MSNNKIIENMIHRKSKVSNKTDNQCWVITAPKNNTKVDFDGYIYCDGFKKSQEITIR